MPGNARRGDRASRRVDGAVAAGVFLLLFGLYLVTLLPGLGGTEDTPKFQYIGSVLGTAHDPGYPLYTMLTFAWSRVPLGTLAYRINVFSAIWGAAACALVFLSMRSLRIHLWTAAAVACAMGLGRTFWQHSVFAEVYTLAAALTAATVLALLWWDATRRLRWLYAAVAAASLAFGTHLIFIGSVPAIVLFVLATLRWRVPWRAVAVSALIVLAGVAQYGYVWVRTAQHSTYLEARARNVHEFVDMMRARQFESMTFKDPPRVVATRRVPAVLKEVRAETGAAAAALAAAGALVLFARRRRVGSLVVGACAGQVVLLAMLGNVAVGPIALPAILLVWILAGCGLDGVCEALQALVPARLAAGATALAAAAIAVVLGIGNCSFNNHRNDTYDTDYMRILLETLPSNAAVVAEDYTLHHMIEYQKVVTRSAWLTTGVPPGPDTVTPLIEGGIRVFAFENAQALLSRWYRMKPIELFGLTLDERLTPLGSGAIVIICGTADPWPELPSLGIHRGQLPRGRAVVVAVKGSGVIARSDTGPSPAIVIPAGQSLGRTGVVAPAEIVAVASGGHAEVRIEGESVIESSRGLVVVEMGRRLESAYPVLPERGMRVGVSMRERPLFEVGGRIPPESCAEAGRGDWVPLRRVDSSVLIGYLDNREPAVAEMELYLASRAPLPVRLGNTGGSGIPEIAVDSFEQGPDGAKALAARLRQDGAPAAEALTTARVVTRVRVRVNDKGDFSAFSVLLGGIADFAMARGHVDAPAGPRATVCAAPLEPLSVSNGLPDTDVYLGPGGDSYFGLGWGGAQQTVFGFEREMLAEAAELSLPLEAPEGLDVAVRLGGTQGAGTAELIVNNRSLGSRPYSAGWNTLAWSSPAAAWAAGINRVTLRVQGATFPRIQRIRLALADPGSLK